ncbi:EF-hand domain-containing protein [Coralliovum pocilloporae]|uniref:EF-hand domain-containing protein n=1 Tax=Coralliovum pocilloporae TaxID=3066369 RepID=UPI0033073AA7
MSKKTETIEVRISPEVKAEFSALCKARGKPLSQIVRTLVEREISTSADDHFSRGISPMTQALSGKWKSFALSTVAVATLAIGWNIAVQTPVTAQSGVRVTFAMLDRNEDGVISRDEFELGDEVSVTVTENGSVIRDVKHPAAEVPKVCRDDFEKFEADADIQKTVETLFTVDADKDGTITYDEFLAAMKEDAQKQFKRLDKDKSAYLNRKELAELAKLMWSEGSSLSPECEQALFKGLPGYPPPAQEKIYGVPADELRVVFAMMDADRNGKINFAEFFDNLPTVEIDFGSSVR